MALNDEEEAALRAEFESTRAALKKANDEAKGNRLTADRLGKNADELRTELEKARTEAAAAVDAVRGELTGKLTAAEQAAAERDKASRERIMRADLRVAARDAGMVDLDGLKLLDTAALKLADDGSVTNAGEAIAELKKSKPWAFGAASTSSTAAPPPADPGKPKLYRDMSEAEQAAWRRQNNQR